MSCRSWLSVCFFVYICSRKNAWISIVCSRFFLFYEASIDICWCSKFFECCRYYCSAAIRLFCSLSTMVSPTSATRLLTFSSRARFSASLSRWSFVYWAACTSRSLCSSWDSFSIRSCWIAFYLSLAYIMISTRSRASSRFTYFSSVSATILIWIASSSLFSSYRFYAFCFNLSSWASLID